MLCMLTLYVDLVFFRQRMLMNAIWFGGIVVMHRG